MKKRIWSIDTINIRDFGITKHKNVDDTACGGGNGLIMRPDVLGLALCKAAIEAHDGKIKVESGGNIGAKFTFILSLT